MFKFFKKIKKQNNNKVELNPIQERIHYLNCECESYAWEFWACGCSLRPKDLEHFRQCEKELYQLIRQAKKENINLDFLSSSIIALAFEN